MRAGIYRAWELGRTPGIKRGLYGRSETFRTSGGGAAHETFYQFKSVSLRLFTLNSSLRLSPKSPVQRRVLLCAQLRDVPRSRLMRHTIRGRDRGTELRARLSPLPPLRRPAN